MTRTQDVQVTLAQPLQAAEIAGERTGIGGDEHAAFAEHRVAGETRPAADQREVIGCVSGCGEGLERPEASPVEKLHIDLPPPGGQRGRSPLTQCADPLGVIGVIVGERDAAETAASVDQRHKAIQVLLRRGAGIDHIRGVAADDPRVGARQRQRAGVLRAQAHDAVRGEPAGFTF